MTTSEPVGDSAREGAVRDPSRSEEDAGRRDRRHAAREAALTKLGSKSGLRMDALVALIDLNHSLKEEAVSLVLEIEILREWR